MQDEMNPDRRRPLFDQVRNQTAYDARYEALKLAYAPIMHQAARLARDHGLLDALAETREGRDLNALAAATGLSPYGARVLLDAALACGLVSADNGTYRLTTMGHFMRSDELTAVSMDFVHEVCYRAMFHLEEAIKTGRPAGLNVFGDWETIYEALSELPDRVRGKWLRFDHFHSDWAFPQALEEVFRSRPRRLLDIGGNTGRWAIRCVEHDPDVRVTIADLPGQLEMARLQAENAGCLDRIGFHPVDLLVPDQSLPPGHDALWMSQFLVCFSEKEIVSILRRAADAMSADSALYVLETFWDQQTMDISAYCMIATSLYFTCLANGNSRVYTFDEVAACIEAAGLTVERKVDQLGLGHTLLVCRKAERD